MINNNPVDSKHERLILLSSQFHFAMIARVYDNSLKIQKPTIHYLLLENDKLSMANSLQKIK